MPRPTRKRQQRLTFTPIPSSSPAAKGYHKQIQDRAAAVTLEGSPSSSMRRPRETVPEAVVDLVSDDEVPISTPAASLEPDFNTVRGNDPDSGSESEPVRSTQRLGSTRRKRPRQQRLDFSNPREPSAFDSPIQLQSSTRTRTSSKPGMFSSQAQGRAGRYSDDESDHGSEDLPSPRRILKAGNTKKKSTKGSKSNNGGVKATRASRTTVEEDCHSDEIVVSDKRQLEGSREQPGEDSGEDTDMPTTQRSQRRRARQPETTRSSGKSPVRMVEEEEEDDESDMPTTQGRQRRKAKRARRNSFISDSPPPAPDSDDEVTVVHSRKRGRSESEDEEEDEEDTLPKTPGRRGLKRVKPLSQRQKEELEEDLDFLGPSDDDAPSSGRRPRDTQSAKKSAREQALERLRRARAGQDEQIEEREDEDNADNVQADDAEEDEEDQDVAEDDGEDYTSSRQFFQEREEDADFVEEEEEEGPLGVPAGIPLEFTRYASLKPKELFKYAVDWMVQKHINAGFQKRDPLYDLTFRKLNDEAQGLAGSKFKSSAWTPAFRYALEARPQIDVWELDGIEMEDHAKCEACNRSNHQCTFKIRFHGKPYDHDSLENVESDNEESDDDDDDNASQASNKVDYNSNGIEIASVDHWFFVGQFCKGNATTSHALQHWRYHLNEFVYNYLEIAGYFEAKALKQRQGWSTKKLGKYASKVLGGMERDGEVTKLWKAFRLGIDEARDSKAGRFEAYSR